MNMKERLKGISIPFRINPGGSVATQSNDYDKLKENIIHILLTGTGERSMRRDYGAGLKQLVHDPNNEALKAIVQHQIANAVGKWEPRIMLQDISISQQQKEGELRVSLEYIIRQTQLSQSLTVPLGLGNL